MDRRSFIAMLTSAVSAFLGGFEQLLRHCGLVNRELAVIEPVYSDFYEAVTQRTAENISLLMIAVRKFRERYAYDGKLVELHLPEPHWQALCQSFARDVRQYVGELSFLKATPEQLLRDYLHGRCLEVHIHDSFDSWSADWYAELMIRGDARTEWLSESRRRLHRAIAADYVSPFVRTYA